MPMRNRSRLAAAGWVLLLAACTRMSAPGTAAPPATSGPLPVFSRPAEISNPYYPVSSIAQTIAFGTDGGSSVREEVTLLPGTKDIAWDGGTTPARVTQFAGYSDGELVEVAYDYFAQADNGDVYYMGEDVANYNQGQVSNHSGSWLAGQDGAPPGLIMPAKPVVGMVFHPENAPGSAYETDEVVSLDAQATTPAGSINNGLFVKETMMDGGLEHKVWAPGYGIVEDQSGQEILHLVLVTRTDAAARPLPGPLQTIEAQAEDIIDIVGGGDWASVQADVAAVAAAWKVYQAQAAADGAPQVIQDALAGELSRLQQRSSANDAPGTLQAANDVSAVLMDLYTVYSPAVPADVGRLDVFERQVLLDAGADDLRAAANSLARVDTIWARVKPLALENKGADVAARFDASLAEQRAAWESKDGAAIAAAANKGLELVDALESLF
jgi:hypothetical protein